MLYVDITAEFIDRIYQWMYGGLGTGGIDGIHIQIWILFHENLSSDLREAYATLEAWMENKSPYWASYCIIMILLLIALDKNTRVILVSPPPS